VALVVVGASLMAPGVAAAATRYAAPDGDGPQATCPESNPCSLSAAVEGPAVANGDEVVVLPGIHQLPGDDPTDFESPINPLQITKAITVHGTPGAPPTIFVGPDKGSVYLNNPGAVLRDVIIENAGLGLRAGLAERVISLSPANYVCYFDQPSTSPVPAPVIRDSACIGDPTGSALSVGVNAGVYAGPPRSVAGKLVNVTAIGTDGIAAFGQDGSSATIEATNVIAIGGPGGHDVSTFTEAGGSAGVGAGATVTLTNSNYQTVSARGPGTSITPPGTGSNQTAEPVLASPSTGDVRQVTGSPTIDAGAVVPLLGSFDFEGQARVQGPAPDIGGDEGSLAAPFTLSAAGREGLRDLEVDLRCRIPECGLRLSGSVRVRGGSHGAAKPFGLKPRTATLAIGDKRKVKLKLDGESRRKVERLLDRGAKGKATIDVDSGEGGYADRERVRLMPAG